MLTRNVACSFFILRNRIDAHLAPRRYQTKDNLFFYGPQSIPRRLCFCYESGTHNTSRQNVFEKRAPHLTCAYAHIFAYCCRSVIDCIDIP